MLVRRFSHHRVYELRIGGLVFARVYKARDGNIAFQLGLGVTLTEAEICAMKEGT